MKVTRYSSPQELAKRAMPMLLRDEAVNNWTIGFLADQSSGSRIPSDQVLTLLAVEDDDGRAIATAVSTGESLVVTRMDPAAVSALVEFIVRENIVQPKTSGPSPTVSVLVGEWAARQRLAAGIGLRMRIMRLTDVRFPPAIPGQFRAATMGDLDVTAPWGEGFSRELGLDPTVDRRNVARRIELNRLFLWCDPEPVSMAGISGPTPNGIRINFVYTPPEHRGKGYARACVARLSQSMLDSGKKFVFLYVDADNPTTNRLYSSIGYDPVCDWEDWRFEASGQ